MIIQECLQIRGKRFYNWFQFSYHWTLKVQYVTEGRQGFLFFMKSRKTNFFSVRIVWIRQARHKGVWIIVWITDPTHILPHSSPINWITGPVQQTYIKMSAKCHSNLPPRFLWFFPQICKSNSSANILKFILQYVMWYI